MGIGEQVRRILVRAARAVAAVAPSILLAACATVTQAPDPTKTAPAAEDGIVVVSVTGNTAQVNQFDQISVRRLPAPGAPETSVRESHVLQQVSVGLARDTALFVGIVPQGEYELERFVDVDTRKVLNLGDGGRQLLGNFGVKPGALVDLGRLIVTPVNTRVIVGRSSLVTSNAELVKRFAPEHAKFYSREVVSGWTRGRGAEDRVEEYALTRPAGADAVTELASGEVAAASRLGTVLLRDKQGRWRRLHSGRLESVLWVKPVDLPNAALVAVGEFNTFLRLDRASGRLVPIEPGNLPSGNLLFFDGNAQAGWFIAQQNGTDVTLYRSAALENGDWRPVGKESVAVSIWSGANSFWAWSTAQGFAYAVSGGYIRYYDYGSGQWTERRAPKENRLISVVPHPGGALGILTSPGGGFGGIFATLYLSRDGGASWEEINSPFNVKMYAPRLTPQGTLLVAGGAFSKPELQASKDGGKTWTQITDKFNLAEQIVVLPSQGLLAIDNGTQFGLAGIRHSADGGATWRLEYSNFDRAAYDAERKRKEAQEIRAPN